MLDYCLQPVASLQVQDMDKPFKGKTEERVPELCLLIAFPPSITNNTYHGKWNKGKIKDTAIQCFGGAFPLLLGRTGADGALGLGTANAEQRKRKEENQYQSTLFHLKDFWQS